MHELSLFLISAVLLFTPLSFGGVQPWAQLVLICCVMLICGLLLFKKRELHLTPAAKPVLLLFTFLFLLALVQSLNVKTIFTAPFWIPFTISPLDTLDFASYILALCGIFIAASQLFERYNHIKMFSIFISCIGVLTALIGFSSVKGEYINFFTGIGLLRETFGPFINRNHASIFLSLCFFASLVWGGPAFLAFKEAQNPYEKKELFLKFFPSFFVSLLLAGGIIFSRSRGGILAFGSGLLLYSFVLCMFMMKDIKKKILAFLLIVGIFISLGIVINNNVKDINRFARRDGENWGYSVETRKNLYSAGYYILMDYKPFGLGLNAFSNGLFPYLDKPIKAYVEHLHNDWLELLTGSGFTGAIFILLSLLWFVAAAYNRAKNMRRDKLLSFAALLSGAFCMAEASFFDFHFFIPSNAVLFFTLTAMACSPTFAKGAVKNIRINKFYAVLWLILFIPFIYITFNKTQAWRYTLLAKSLNGHNQITYYERALKIYPHPRNALRLAIANFNFSNKKDINVQERREHRIQAAKISGEYLKKYPLYKELLNVYNRSK